ncbi:hypothetical protein ACH4D4_17465 [Streptomyces pristinaespiralis]|uniref:hypothetical protein n=1 Tax=Streptomyces pristinaespiralis TaxID=38300 RepID=UPI00378A6E39
MESADRDDAPKDDPGTGPAPDGATSPETAGEDGGTAPEATDEDGQTSPETAGEDGGTTPEATDEDGGTPDSPSGTGAPDSPSGTETSEGAAAEGASGNGRAGLAIAAALLLACGGLVGYGLLDTEETKPKARAVPTAEVTYEVVGEGPVEISYLARSEDGTATVVRDAELPWKKTVQVPLGKPPTVAIVLGEKGGQAACTLAIRGEHVQRATASGEFGRATCAGELPAAGQ